MMWTLARCTAENTDPDCGPVTPIDIAGWGVTVRKSVAEYEVETACACGFVFSGETPEGRQHAGFAGALAINAHVAELKGLAQAFMFIITRSSLLLSCC